MSSPMSQAGLRHRGGLVLAGLVLAGLVMATLLLTYAGDASAQLSVWRAAAEPKHFAQRRVYEQAEQALSDHFWFRRQPAVFRRIQTLNKARRLLERAGAAHARDPRLRYQLASAYHGLFNAEQDEDRLEQAAEHYSYVVNHPITSRSLRAEALNDLALVHARLGNHGDETTAYTGALELEPHAETRALLLANRAEGFMVQGDILRAVRGYRESLAATPSPAAFRLNVTTLWGLAVALDRSGNLDGALRRVHEARTMDPIDSRINGPNWFYVPRYDEHWYHALGHWQHARAQQDAVNRGAALRAAVASWRRYIELAPRTDHWRALAERRLHQCERELHKALGH